MSALLLVNSAPQTAQLIILEDKPVDITFDDFVKAASWGDYDLHDGQTR
ncbi:MAG: hypothetical protein LW709_02760 [Oxalobacteraceae bacterium]|jgi:hypothetical protein|nr:hypothetical protein [Oxalobacteraceae bacterium]MCE2830980.1 hypothetical protein [Oxalobacteraceae bacterium]